MTVKEILIAAAENLGFADKVSAYLNGTSTDAEAEAKNLLRCFNIVENELALDYLPLTCEEEILSEAGVIYFSEFTRSIVRVLKVQDRFGNDVPFKLFPKYLKTQPRQVTITYTYTPYEKNFDDESDFVLHASVRMLAYGVAAEYSLAIGLFEEAAVWEKKYKDAISAAYRATKSKTIRARRWA